MGRRKEAKPAKRASDVHQPGNLEAARIIASAPEKYPPGSLPAVWAGAVLAKARTITGPLFERRVA
jgi:hypothetical protein